MFSRIRKHFTYANVALTLALVFAMTGGAYAASKYLISSTKQIKPSVLKQLQGKTGAKGPAGPQGPSGPAGAKGETGPVGKEGPSGVSVSAKEVKTTETTCAKQGGSSFTTGSTTALACNGKEGKEGKEGSPWTAGGTLPKDSSEHGQWALSGNSGSETSLRVEGISFPIPLAKALPPAKTHVISLEEGSGEAKEAAAIKSGECTGTWKAPGAASENLCVFLQRGLPEPTKLEIENAEGEGLGTGVSGALITEGQPKKGLFFYTGSWVVTG